MDSLFFIFLVGGGTLNIKAKMYLSFLSLILIILFSSCSKPNNNIVNPTMKAISISTSTSTSIPTSIPTSNAIASPHFSSNKSLQSSQNKNAVLPILYYHAVSDSVFGLAELFVSPKEFDKQMKYLKDSNYTSISFKDIDHFKDFANPVIITFDDGYENNYQYAYPILKKYNLKATIFVCSGFIGGSTILKKSQMLEMTDLINFESHTITHPDLTKLDQKQLEHEIIDSKKAIEAITNKEVTGFCYPTGFYNQASLNIIKRYYKYAVLNTRGCYKENDDKYLIKRLYISRDFDIIKFVDRLKNGR